MINSILPLFDISSILGALFVAQDAGIEAIRFFGIKLINPTDFWGLIIRFGFNFIIIYTLIKGVYYSKNKRKEYVFIFFLMNIVIFLLCFILQKFQVELGFALGLFAMFGIIRYRTDPIPIKEMTYIFMVVGIGVFNALAGAKISYAELLLANLIIIFITWYLERFWMTKQNETMRITYEKIELVHPERKKELIQDLKDRTGLDVVSVSIVRMNFMRDSVRLMISYKPKK